ncbi:flagellar protein FliT [Lysinibacillus piscis]|uniref:Flagellar protein FliT n=1 Tax=Lysinibacillus piscis TaxID=2518931 RepID=A0ABQ5NHL3_9BACI|nr:flagellar protein FliT [Lysinibacillus sp. KH24]GLC87788.1 hypothetical protein LYSBPC_09150 [Lysinibacillus sp. KH24]
MQLINQLLQVSANLYKILGEIPIGEERDGYIEHINDSLNKRGDIIDMLMKNGFQFNQEDRIHCTLLELDNGIKERLVVVMNAVKQDMANLQRTKKSEIQYQNPYSDIRTMDGMYYDKKN